MNVEGRNRCSFSSFLKMYRVGAEDWGGAYCGYSMRLTENKYKGNGL